MSTSMNRRDFVAAAAAAGVALSVGTSAKAADKPAALGGKPVRTKPFPRWPVVNEADEKAVGDVLRSGRWFYDRGVVRFQDAWAKMNGAKYCTATSSGTAALYASLAALGVGPGDEVILPPYTFVATLSVVMLHYALPIFVDSDIETFLMDPKKIEPAITDRTAAILPVHIGGSVCDMDSILAIAKKHKLPVVEDACQAHLGQWKGRNVGSLGDTGCFSFQVTKNLPSGEGGAILTSSEQLAVNCHAFHNCGRKRPGVDLAYHGGLANNLRMTEFQANLLVTQMERIEQNAKIRSENADYLSAQLRQVPGIAPARMYEGCTRNAYHLYMFRYDSKQFAGLPRSKFISALSAEGIPASSGYTPLNKSPHIRDTLARRSYQRLFSKAELDRWEERVQCRANDRLCQEAVWFTQNLLLGPREDMDQIAEAFRKIHAHAGELAKA